MRHMLAAVLFGLLAACGGGGGGSGDGGGASGGGGGPSAPAAPPPTTAEAGRLLEQASFGASEASIAQVQSQGVSGWINAQLALAQPAQTHQAYIDARAATVTVSANQFYESWFKQATSADDQLRQRTAFALSQIFVISLNDPNVDVRGAASYYDMLERDAFGNFRKLLEDVTLHPMMGRYLTYLGNQKEDAAGTRTPDENYAREVMQLMTLGLFQLNTDGTQKLIAGAPTASYTPDDIKGLAKVFTGLSWYSPSPNNTTFLGGNAHTDRTITPMIFYPNYHSISAKTFLGVTIPATTAATGDTMASDLKTALDTLYNHPNVGPFIATRLIQQMVTSNPSAAYVGRVAGVFNNNGAGVRGDMGAVVKAVLTDAEARDAGVGTSASFGKLREPLIRATNWLRAFKGASQTGNWLVSSTSASTSLGQSPLASPSVFNFWRPGFVPPSSTALGAANLKSPEFQIVDEVSTASWVNAIQDWVNAGLGSTAPSPLTGRDIQVNYAAEIALADNPAGLVDRMNLLLFYGQMTDMLKARLVAAVTAVAIPTLNATGSNQAAIDTAKLNRAKTVIFMSLISPEYLVQR